MMHLQFIYFVLIWNKNFWNKITTHILDEIKSGHCILYVYVHDTLDVVSWLHVPFNDLKLEISNVNFRIEGTYLVKQFNWNETINLLSHLKDGLSNIFLKYICWLIKMQTSFILISHVYFVKYQTLTKIIIDFLMFIPISN